MRKESSFPLIFVCFFVANANATLPIYPAEIIARDLSLKGAGWTGHVGITTAPSLYDDAYQVIEVLWEEPTIQTNTIVNFKSKSKYWGSRYGISDRGNNALRILREANFQKDLGCAAYTLGVNYDVSTGGYDGTVPHPTHCGFFRCDTFVNYVFHWGNYTLPTYNPPGSPKNASIPRYVFNAFPHGNEDGPFSLEAPLESGTSLIDPKILAEISINTATSAELVNMSPEEFYTVVDISNDNITNDGIKNLLKLAEDPILGVDKRIFLMDKLGFVGTVDMIPSLIQLYNSLINEDDLPIKSQIIASTLNLYQRYSMLEQHFHEKTLLEKFYLDSMDHQLFARDKAIMIRGFISLSSNEKIISNIDKIRAKINEQENPLNPQTALKLKMELFNKSSKLEGLMLSDIVNMLQHENNSELDGVFNAFIVHRLSHLGPDTLTQQSKDEISIYLDSIKFKYNTQNKLIVNDEITLFSYGAWLEATALVNSTSLNEAGKYVAKYLHDKDLKEQESYIIGLSNSEYMKQAFKTEPVLIEFKKMRKSIYFNTVGIPTK